MYQKPAIVGLTTGTLKDVVSDSFMHVKKYFSFIGCCGYSQRSTMWRQRKLSTLLGAPVKGNQTVRKAVLHPSQWQFQPSANLEPNPNSMSVAICSY